MHESFRTPSSQSAISNCKGLRDEVRKAEISRAMDAPYPKKTKRSALIEIENRRKMASNVA
jgi:hypothetical protein